MKITPIDYVLFVIQVLFQSTAKLVCTIVGLPIIALALLKVKAPAKHPFYPYVDIKHRPTYIDKGSSGLWEYWQLPNWGGVTKPYQNLNYGLLGEPSGRWSALREGDERSYPSMFRQCAIRNPSNGFRYMDMFSCQVDNCDIVYQGDAGPLDIQPELVPGMNFVKARDKDTGKTYYSFQWVGRVNKTHGFRIRFGFKVEPSHIVRGDLPPEKERCTFTVRLNPYKAINAFEK